MNESEIIKLDMKVSELKNAYETAKKQRENISSNMSLLDEKIATYDKELKELEKELSLKQKIKEKQEKNIKPSIKKTIFIFGTCLLMNSIAAIFLKDIVTTTKITTLSLVVPALLASVTINLLPNILLNRHYSKDYDNTEKKYDNLKQERKEIITKRTTLGSKYKDIRESEELAKKIYKETEKILSSELTHLYNSSDEYQSIDTKDIYHKIKVDESYYQESTENKKRIIDDLIKKYLIEKLIESNFNKINLFVDNLSTEDLFSILSERVPKNNHHEVLSNIIHAILGICGNMQNYGIVWFEEDDENLITNPKVFFDENDKWTELKTNKNTPYEIIFKTVYNTFTNTFTDKVEHKRKREK